MTLLAAWAIGTFLMGSRASTLMSMEALHGWKAGLLMTSVVIQTIAQSLSLFFLLGFVGKSIGYLLLRERHGCPPEAKGRPVAVLYLTAGDFDRVAVDSLLRLRTKGPRLLLLHDDGADAEARERMLRFLETHPAREGWEMEVWHRPVRRGGKAGAVNWVVERLDPRWELLLLCDNDSVAIDRDAIDRAEAEFDAPDVSIVQFRNVGFSEPGEPPFLKRLARAIDVFDVFAASQARWGYVPFFGHNALVRIEDLRRQGGFTPGFFSDDLDLSARLTLAGKRIVYRRDLTFAERQPADFGAFRKRARKWAHGCVQVIRSRALDVITAPRLPFAHRIGLLEFMAFYPALAATILGLMVSHLVLPWLAPVFYPLRFYAGAGAFVIVGVFAPTLAWSIRNRSLSSWPAFAWICSLVYGGSILASARGVVDGLRNRETAWVPTNIPVERPLVPRSAWGESLLGLALLCLPWLFRSEILSFPATYVFITIFLFAPITYAAYRADAPARSRPVRDIPFRRTGLTAAGIAVLLLLQTQIAIAATGAAASPAERHVRVKGSSLLVDGRPFQVRGVHYSPWLPGTGPDGRSPYPGPDVVEPDLRAIRDLGGNTILVNRAPGWVISRAHEMGLWTIYEFSIGWNDTSRAAFDRQSKEILAGVDSLRVRPGLMAWILGNEVPTWVVGELGAPALEARLRDLADQVRQHDPDHLLGHANWPPTKELNLSFLDLACFNVYPAWPYEVSVKGFGPYIRDVLTPLTAGKPFLISEFGINSLEAGEQRQAEVLKDCWQEITKSPVIGGVVFSWADEWWKNYDNPLPGKGYWERGYDTTDAERQDNDPEEYYGIVRADRSHKPAYDAIRESWMQSSFRARSPVPWVVLAIMGLATVLASGLFRRRRPGALGGALSAVVLALLLGLPDAVEASTSLLSWTRGDTLTGFDANDQFGWALASSGDIDADGCGDVAVGARFFNVGQYSAAGAVYVYRGCEPAGSPPLLRIDGLSSDEHFGESLSGGRDVNGDGIADLVVGAPLRTTLGNSASGAVDLFLGGSGFGGTRWGTLDGEAQDDWFGQSVAVGDLDGDGLAEIIVGAPYNDRGGSAAGAVFIYRGGSSPPTTPYKILVGENSNDQFGWSVAYLGDFDGDGYGDIAVGARLYGSGPIRACGKVYLFRGGSTMDTVPDGVWLGNAADDWFGNSVAGPGDADGGGRADILVGAPYSDAGASNAGAAYLIRGENPPGSPPAAVYIGTSADGQFGWSVGAPGDVDIDGHPDMLAGARMESPGGLSAAGRVYCYAGGANLPTSPLVTADGEAADDWFGNAVGSGIGYFTPSRGAALAGAPYNDAGGSAAGRAYVLGLGSIAAVSGVTLLGGPLRVWPNPISGSNARFAFEIPLRTASRSIALTIYDTSGRQVRGLIYGPGPASVGTVGWDGRDDAGRPVPAAGYVARLTAGRALIASLPIIVVR